MTAELAPVGNPSIEAQVAGRLRGISLSLAREHTWKAEIAKQRAEESSGEYLRDRVMDFFRRYQEHLPEEIHFTREEYGRGGRRVEDYYLNTRTGELSFQSRLDSTRYPRDGNGWFKLREPILASIQAVAEGKSYHQPFEPPART